MSKIKNVLEIISFPVMLLILYFISVEITALNPQPPYSACISKYCTATMITGNGFIRSFEMLADIYLFIFPLILLLPLLTFFMWLIIPPNNHWVVREPWLQRYYNPPIILFFIYLKDKILRKEKKE